MQLLAAVKSLFWSFLSQPQKIAVQLFANGPMLLPQLFNDSSKLDEKLFHGSQKLVLQLSAMFKSLLCSFP
jgi:hypothetical protein